MPKNVLQPANDFVMVVDGARETTLDGISLPDNVRQQEMVFGAVVFIGPLVNNTKIFDRVIYGPYAGKTIVMDGVEYRLLREGQIEAYIRTVENEHQ